MNPLNPLYDAVAWVINQLHSGLGALFGPASGLTWALTIVVLVILMRLLLLPLFIKQMHATRKMAVLAPQVAELKKKYKNDKQKLNEETMKLYKENGANPLAGCLPVAAQLPVFFALFGVLRTISQDHPNYGLTAAVVTSAQHAHIFGVTVADRFLSSIKPPTLYPLSTSGRLVILITVVISAATTFLTVRQSTKRGMTPQMTPDNPMASSQKFMAYIVPVFALSGLYWQYGLVLYWVTTNLWTLGQQHVLFKRFPPLTPQGAAGTATGAAGSTGSAARQSAKPAAKTPARPANRPPVNQLRGGNRPPVNQLRGGNKQSGSAKPGGTAAAGKGVPGKAAPGKTVPGKAAPGKRTPSKGTADKVVQDQVIEDQDVQDVQDKQPEDARPAGAAAKPSANGSSGGGAGGALRRLVKGRAEPEPQPAPPETKLVRQQPVRQPRSRRSGKR